MKSVQRILARGQDMVKTVQGVTILINALSADRGGARSLLNMLAEESLTEDFRLLVLTPKQTLETSPGEHMVVVEKLPDHPLKRWLAEWSAIRGMARDPSVRGVLHLGNFISGGGALKHGVYQRNSLLLCREFQVNLLRRGLVKFFSYIQAQRMLALHSVRRADLVITPSEAFRQKVIEAVGEKHSEKIFAVPYGIHHEIFTNPLPLNARARKALEETEGMIRLLHVGYYSYYKNFTTLIRAIPYIVREIGERVRVVMTAEIGQNVVQHIYDSTGDWKLMKELKVEKYFVTTGPLPYRMLPHLYRHADVLVWPSITESFGFPLLEAAFFGLPVAASDIPVHREVRPDGFFFPTYEPQALAKAVLHALSKGRTSETEARKKVPHIREHFKGVIDLIARYLV